MLYLSNRFDKAGKTADLEEAIALGRRVVNLRTPDHPYLSTSLENLVILLRNRYQKDGAVGDLQEIITHERAILELQQPGHPKRASFLTTLQRDIMEMIDKPRTEVGLDTAITLAR